MWRGVSQQNQNPPVNLSRVQKVILFYLRLKKLCFVKPNPALTLLLLFLFKIVEQIPRVWPTSLFVLAVTLYPSQAFNIFFPCSLHQKITHTHTTVQLRLNQNHLTVIISTEISSLVYLGKFPPIDEQQHQESRKSEKLLPCMLLYAWP